MSSPREPGIWDIVAEEWAKAPQDYEIESAQQLEKLLNELKVPDGAKILELAAGTGFPSSYLASKGYKTTVTDFSENMIKKAKEYYERAGLQGDFQVLDMFKISKETVGTYDVVFIQHVFDHYDGWEVIQVLEKMKEIARYVIVLSQNPKCMPYLLFHRAMVGRGEWRWGLSILRYGVKDLAELAGLEVIKETYFSATTLSKWMAQTVSPETGELYADSLAHNLIPEDQRHFRVLVGKAREKEITPVEENRILRSAFRSELDALRNTYYLDTTALKKLSTKLQEELKSKIGR